MVRASQERLAEQQLNEHTTAPSNQQTTSSPETRQIRRKSSTIKKLCKEPHHPAVNGKRPTAKNQNRSLRRLDYQIIVQF